MARSLSGATPVPLQSLFGEQPDAGETFDTAIWLALDTPFEGGLSRGTDSIDCFGATSTQDGVLDVDLTGLTGNVSALVYNAAHQLVAAIYSGAHDQELHGSILVEENADYFVVIATAPSNSTSYQLTFSYGPGTGTADDDTMTGSYADEIIAGLAGNDLLSGLGGRDSLFGGDGADTLRGGGDADKLYAGLGQDVLLGGTGDDSLFAGQDATWLVGDAGRDFLMGDIGNDTGIGGAGGDWLFGDAGNDKLHGGLGKDTLYGEQDNDSLYGGDDNDVLVDRSGSNLLSGGAGNDTLLGGTETDRLVGGSGDDHLDGGRGDDAAYGGDGNDMLFGGRGADTLIGGDGNDQLFGGVDLPPFGHDGANVLAGGAGADTLVGSTGRDSYDLGHNDGASDVVIVQFANESRTDGRMDQVVNFTSGTDVLDFSAIDPDAATAGDQSFLWGDTTATAGGLWYVAAGQDALVCIDVTGDAVADACWRMVGVTALQEADFLL